MRELEGMYEQIKEIAGRRELNGGQQPADKSRPDQRKSRPSVLSGRPLIEKTGGGDPIQKYIFRNIWSQRGMGR